jgi:orotate phosphoribosyltransferase
LADAVELIKLIKKAAIEAVNATNPAAVCFGKVTKASPLKIYVEQKLTLTAKQLVLARKVTENRLVVGDEVILFREQGGQRYIVVDRVG